MSETTWPESTDNPPVGKKRELIGLIVLLSYLAALIVFYHWKGHTWPSQLKRGILIGPLPPQSSEWRGLFSLAQLCDGSNGLDSVRSRLGFCARVCLGLTVTVYADRTNNVGYGLWNRPAK